VLAVLFALAAAAFLFGNRWLYLRRRQAPWDARRQLGATLIIAGCALIVIALAAPRGPAAIGLAAACLVALAAYDAGDLASFHHFGGALGENIGHLPLPSRSRPGLTLALASLRAYLPARRFLAGAALLLALLILATHWRPSLPIAATGAALCVVVGLALARRRRGASRRGLSVADWRIVAADDTITTVGLRHADRAGSFALAEPPAHLPDGVLIVVLESAGAHLRSADDANSLLADRIAALSGVPQQWLRASNMVANSACTEVVLPALLTGAAPHESVEALHRLPFVFDLAKARNYRTAFFTSTSMNWENFDGFFGAARIDEMFTAERSGLPYINDTSVDDHAIARQLAQWIEQSDERFFALLYANALHNPFQTESEIAIPTCLSDRRARATYVIEKQCETLFSSLAASGRLDRTLILVVGDHGEVFGEPREGEGANWNRQSVLHDKVVRPLFALKPPSDLPADLSEMLRANLDKLICDIDIAPSFAHLFGATLARGSRYPGCNLFAPVPDDRIAYVLNTNEWRDWGKSAAAVYRGCSSVTADYLDRRLSRYQTRDCAGPAYEREELLRLALAEPLVRKAMARVYKDKLRRV
jgi:hypothetical protein